MEGHARTTALLDACVLYPLAITDALLSLATAGFFLAKWTRKIEREWLSALEADRPDLAGKLEVRRDSRREAIVDWEVYESAYFPFVSGLTLPDRDDAHVLAAAIAGHVDCIVTSNLKDFPSTILTTYGIEAVDPDSFIVDLWESDPLNAIAAFKSMRSRRKKPESSPEDFAFALEIGGLPSTAQKLRAAATFI